MTEMLLFSAAKAHLFEVTDRVEREHDDTDHPQRATLLRPGQPDDLASLEEPSTFSKTTS